MGRFRPQSRHILPFIPQFSWILNEFTLFDLSAVGLGTTQKMGHGLAALAQLGQSICCSLSHPLAHPFDVTNRYRSGIDKANQKLSAPHRQPQLEAAQGNQAIDLLPPSPTGLSLAGSFGRNNFLPTCCAAPALDQHFLHAQPAHCQHKHPAQNPIRSVLGDLPSTLWAGMLLFRLSWFCLTLCRLWFRPWFVIDQYFGQGLLQLIQIITQSAFCYLGLSRRRCNIYLLQSYPNRLDFFFYCTYPISYGAASW